MKQIIHTTYVLEKEDSTAIRVFQAKNDLSQEQLAAKLGISRQYLNRIIARKEKLSSKLLEKFNKLGIFNKEE